KLETRPPNERVRTSSVLGRRGGSQRGTMMRTLRHGGVIRLVTLLIVFLALSLPIPTEAQPAGGVIPRLCFLTFDPGTLESNRFKPFFEGLRELGYVDGRTITLKYLSAEGQGDRFPALAAECLRLEADI